MCHPHRSTSIRCCATAPTDRQLRMCRALHHVAGASRGPSRQQASLGPNTTRRREKAARVGVVGKGLVRAELADWIVPPPRFSQGPQSSRGFFEGPPRPNRSSQRRAVKKRNPDHACLIHIKAQSFRGFLCRHLSRNLVYDWQNTVHASAPQASAIATAALCPRSLPTQLAVN